MAGAKKEASDDESSAISPVIVVPIFCVAGYLVFLKNQADQLYAEAVEMANSGSQLSPFHNLWISGPLTFSVIYLLAIFFGQKIMATRAPFKIKPFIFIYNLYQCLLNAWGVYAMIHEVATNNSVFSGMWGNKPLPGLGSFRIAFLVWIHYNNKYVELLDTLWMILRKKNNQISFLHCYHHLLLIWAWYYCGTIDYRGDVYFGALVNSFIHVIMYAYYAAALVGIPCPWKKYITSLQLLQFCFVLSHSIYVIYVGNMPIQLPLAQGFVMINMLVLFTQFYNNAYGKKGPAAVRNVKKSE